MSDPTMLPRHPLNTAFAWESHTGPLTTLTDEQVAAYDDDGFFVFEDAFGSEDLAPVVADLDEREARIEGFLSGLEDERFFIAEAGAITFAPNLAHASPVLAAFASDPTVLGICRDLVGTDVDLYWDQAVYKKPDKPRRFPWHQDNGYTYVEPQQYLTCWIALTDATEENGCPHVVPGLHRLGTLEHHYVEPLGWQIFEDPPDDVPAPVGAGGIVVFSSLTPHLTGPNTTDAVRKAYILQYCPAGAEVVESRQGGTTSRSSGGEGPHRYPVLRAGEACPIPGWNDAGDERQTGDR